MNARYIRTSMIHQNEQRQLARQHSNEILYIDKISGSTRFEDRPKANELLSAIKKGEITYISVSSIDRLGRSTLNVLQTIDTFTKLGVVLKVDNLGLESLVNGKENPTFKLIVSVLANIAEMERTTLRERQLEGIQMAKLNGTYKGRVKGSTESKEEVLKKYRSVVYHIQRKTNSYIEIAKLCDCSKNTVLKVNKILCSV